MEIANGAGTLWSTGPPETSQLPGATTLPQMVAPQFATATTSQSMAHQILGATLPQQLVAPTVTAPYVEEL